MAEPDNTAGVEGQAAYIDAAEGAAESEGPEATDGAPTEKPRRRLVAELLEVHQEKSTVADDVDHAELDVDSPLQEEPFAAPQGVFEIDDSEPTASESVVAAPGAGTPATLDAAGAREKPVAADPPAFDAPVTLPKTSPPAAAGRGPVDFVEPAGAAGESGDPFASAAEGEATPGPTSSAFSAVVHGQPRSAPVGAGSPIEPIVELVEPPAGDGVAGIATPSLSQDAATESDETTTSEEPVVLVGEEPIVPASEEPIVPASEEPVIQAIEERVVPTSEEPTIQWKATPAGEASANHAGEREAAAEPVLELDPDEPSGVLGAAASGAANEATVEIVGDAPRAAADVLAEEPSDAEEARLAPLVDELTSVLVDPTSAVSAIDEEPVTLDPGLPVAEDPVIDPASLADEPAIIADEPAIIADEHAIIADEPAIIADEPALIADEPVPIGGESAIVADEPTWIAPEPALTGDESARPADDPVLKGDEPARPADDPVLKGDEPALVADEPALTSDAPASMPDLGYGPSAPPKAGIATGSSEAPAGAEKDFATPLGVPTARNPIDTEPLIDTSATVLGDGSESPAADAPAELSSSDGEGAFAEADDIVAARTAASDHPSSSEPAAVFVGEMPAVHNAVKWLVAERDRQVMAAERDGVSAYELATSIDAFVDAVIRTVREHDN